MKTKILIPLAILLLAVTATFAKSPKTELQQTIKSHIVYPEDLVKKLIQGSVFVEFTIKNDGKIEVLNCNSLSGDLMVYVVDELSSIALNVSPELYGQNFTMRFDFKLE